MEGLLELLLKNGAFGVLAAAGFLLYLKERKLNAEYTKESRRYQIEETRSKVKMTYTLEDLVETVKALGTNSKNDMNQCQSRVETMIQHVRSSMQAEELRRAKEAGKEAGRREVTSRIAVPPKGGEHEPG